MQRAEDLGGASAGGAQPIDELARNRLQGDGAGEKKEVR